MLNIKKHLWTDFKKRRNYQHLLDEGLLSNVDPTQCKLETLSDEDSPILQLKEQNCFPTIYEVGLMADSIFGFLNKDIYTDSSSEQLFDKYFTFRNIEHSQDQLLQLIIVMIGLYLKIY